MASTATAAPSGGGVVKHRACDECRTRKLACSKEPKGCTRCVREGIPCHYSAQKPMGRPRKRPRDEPTSECLPPTKNQMVEIPPDTTDPGLAFINMLVGGDIDFDLPTEADVFQEHHQNNTAYTWNFGYTGDASAEVNFDPVPAVQPETSTTFSPANLDPALFMSSELTPPIEQVPDLTPNSANTPESSLSTQNPPPTCFCNTNLYLALDSMQKLDQRIELAIRQARLAAKTAYEVVNCPVCSFKMELPIDLCSPLRIRVFQNLMLLATLIPSIVCAYERILRVVDEESDKAKAEQRQLEFRLPGLGGVWGSLASDDPCNIVEAYSYRVMDPTMWRLIVRALLKVDVYGLSGDTRCNGNGGSYADPFHLGLKDIVILMENKSKARHAFLDTMAATPGAGYHLPKSCEADEVPRCQKIIAIAKQSIDDLVIA
ncbi:hypothetical protein F4778DRAFT_791064 [Xylariomycetidae sp. FL2044]|nr:hypothetical protein F4778DRAFT_791064 [Xylariomycetidae sp. FL2044]